MLGTVVAPETLLVPEWTVPTLGRPVDPGYLGDLRGGVDLDEDAVDALIDVDGTVTDTTADNVVTGSNIIRDGSFANASGLNTVIQNTGANVLIQNATIVQVEFADPLP